MGYWDNYLNLGECNCHLQGTVEPWQIVIPWDYSKSPDGWVASDSHCSLFPSLREPPPRQGRYPTQWKYKDEDCQANGGQATMEKTSPCHHITPGTFSNASDWGAHPQESTCEDNWPLQQWGQLQPDTLPDAQTMAQNTEACAAAANGMVLPQPQKCGCKCAGTSALSTECAQKWVCKFHVAERGIIVGWEVGGRRLPVAIQCEWARCEAGVCVESVS